MRNSIRVDLPAPSNPSKTMGLPSIDMFKYPRMPIKMGEVAGRESFEKPASITLKDVDSVEGVEVVSSEKELELFSENGLYIEDMPIKFPNTEFGVPIHMWNNFYKSIIQLIDYEKELNDDLDGFYVYLTIQQTRVSKGSPQRKRGVHVDGFQKSTIIPQTIQHKFIVSNCVPTIFYKKAFDADKLKRPKKEFFAELSEQFKDAEVYDSDPYGVYLFNAYCPHQAGLTDEDSFRTIIRMSISKLPFMGTDNTRNPLFDYDWDLETKKEFYRSISL